MNRDPLVALAPELQGGAPRGDARFVMGVDGGATKTLAAVVDLERHELHLGHGGPSNQDAIGADAAVKALRGAADQALERAGAADEQLGAAVVAVAGTDTESVREHVRRHCSPSWLVVNDVVGAWATATGASDGVAVIAGTGSNVFGVGPRGPWRAGGWGHVLGDEGSGYWLGVQSIKAALSDREGSGPETALSEAVMRFFGTDSVEALAGRVYTEPLTKGEIAAFAVQTAKLAQAGDAVARELYGRGARELAIQVAAVIRETGLTGRAFPVGLIGSVFRARELYADPLAEAVRELAPEARVAAVEMEPVGGSLLLAARVAGREQQLPAAALARLLEGARGELAEQAAR